MSAVRYVVVGLLVVLLHAILAYWLWLLPQPEKPAPVQLLSLEWIDAPAPVLLPEPQASLPPPESLVSVKAPEPALMQQEEAPPSPSPKLIKPLVKQPRIKPVDQKTPVAEPSPPVEAVKETSEPVSAPMKQLIRAEADYLHNPKPSYPRLSKRMGEQGEVRLKVQVGLQGEVLVVELLRTSGFERLDEAAIEAVKSWRFKPAQQGGEPVISWVEIPVKFILEEA